MEQYHQKVKTETKTQTTQSCQPAQLITSLLPLTVVPRGEVPAALTLSGLGVAIVAVAVALARPALREAPEARQAVGALAAGDAL